MKKYFLLIPAIILVAFSSCKETTELTDSDKEALVQSVKQASQEYWAAFGVTYDNESFSKVKKYIDENSDIIWQTDPVAIIYNKDIINKQADSFDQLEKMIGSRISGTTNILEAHYSVLSDDKVLEVVKVDFSYMTKDSTIGGPNTLVTTAIWANIDGEWVMQLSHNSY